MQHYKYSHNWAESVVQSLIEVHARATEIIAKNRDIPFNKYVAYLTSCLMREDQALWRAEKRMIKSINPVEKTSPRQSSEQSYYSN